ncbi:4Fe-4S dicluster domain-containing protein [Anoxybacterium hadale]|uniref:4Fe-4S dicluster domain-containing protein n=1 Tax=Anoxybacterium hadale TaxID=3408580 RepID=A0ACD1AF83_9FIRM|nr:4Fe-4S dicluster domain-containing protein [Clostridiales bacterium]
MIHIDAERCINCMQCVKVCPFQVLEGGGGKPECIRENLCIQCLHCAAACPREAVSLDDLNGTFQGDFPSFSDNFSDQIEHHLLTRRSYRSFKSDVVDKNIIAHALQTSAWAPSAKNDHPTEWIVVSGKPFIQEIMDHILSYVDETGISPEIASLYKAGHNIVTGTANTLILAAAKTTAINPSVDTALALYNAELVLQANGLGTCWAGYLTRMCNQIPSLRQLINLPEDCQIYNALMVGYPDQEHYLHIPNRKKQPAIHWIETATR